MPEELEMVTSLRKAGKYAKSMYAKRPMSGENDPGWVVVITRSNMEDYMIRGFVPLWQYGYIQNDQANRWVQILQHPKGPSEFPVDQVLTLRWYRPKDCPLPGVKFPQLAGHKVKEYPCPECRRTFYAHDGLGGVADLAHHLKYIHSWDRPSLVKYGETMGIDFNAVWANLQKTYEFDVEPEPEPEAPVDESGLETVGKYDCDACDWKPKPRAKVPGTALMMHKRHAHPEPVPA